MRNRSSMASRVELHVLVVALALIAFTRPVLLMFDVARPKAVLLSFFVPWAIVVGLLYAMSRTYGRAPPGAGDDADRPKRG